MVRWLTPVLAAVFLAACTDGTDRLTGSWIQVSGERPESRLTLNADGTGEMRVHGGVPYDVESWTVSGGNLLDMQIEGQKVLASFVLNEESIVISRAENFRELNGTYRKVPAPD